MAPGPHDATEPLRNEVRRLGRDVERLTALLHETAGRASRGDQAAAQVTLALQYDERQQAEIKGLPAERRRMWQNKNRVS